MAEVRRGTRDPRAYREAPDPVSNHELVERTAKAYVTGWQDAVNNTVDIAATANGRKALRQVADGDPKAYRKTIGI